GTDPARLVNPVAARGVENSPTHTRFDGEEGCAKAPPEGIAEVVDVRGVQVSHPVAINVHPDLDDPDELHKVGGRLLNPVPERDKAPGWGGCGALLARDDVVAVLVDAPPSCGKCYGRATCLVHCQGAEGAEAAPDAVDHDGRDPVFCHRSGHHHYCLLAAGEAEDRHRPAALGRGTGRQDHVEVNLVVT